MGPALRWGGPVTMRPLCWSVASSGRRPVGAWASFGSMQAFLRDSSLVRFALWASVLSVPAVAQAHEWYPIECCAGLDCAPADSVVRQDDGSYLVTTHGMSVVIPANYPYWRASPDGRIHACIRKLKSGNVFLICAFRGPGT